MLRSPPRVPFFIKTGYHEECYRCHKPVRLLTRSSALEFIKPVPDKKATSILKGRFPEICKEKKIRNAAIDFEVLDKQNLISSTTTKIQKITWGILGGKG